MKIEFIITLVFVFSLFSCTLHELEERDNGLEDLNYFIDSVYWSDTSDKNGNGYYSRETLNFSLKLTEDVSRTIQPSILYKASDSTEFRFYGFVESTLIQGDSADNIISIELGYRNKPLARNTYDFGIEIYQRNYSRVEVSLLGNDEPNTINFYLGNQPIEPSHADLTYSCSAWWTNHFDRTNNGYSRYAKLNVDVDVNDNITTEVKVDIFYKKVADTLYTYYGSIDKFSITSDNNGDAVKTEIGYPVIELENGEYDFKVDVIDALYNFVIDSFSSDVAELNGQKFENLDEDTFFYSIADMEWLNEVDVNGNGFAQSRDLVVDVDVDKEGDRTLAAQLYMKAPDSTEYSLVCEKENFIVNGISANDKMSMTVYIDTTITMENTVYGDLIMNIYEADTDGDETRPIEIEAATEDFSDVFSRQMFEDVDSDSVSTPEFKF